MAVEPLDDVVASVAELWSVGLTLHSLFEACIQFAHAGVRINNSSYVIALRLEVGNH